MQDLILSFNVEGSTGNIYNIEFIKKIEGISASCNCDAA
jgi:DNA-dependent RNA polymerase auxiliary subunit epsilon